MVSVFSDGALTAKLDRWNDAVGDRYNRLKETDGSRRVIVYNLASTLHELHQNDVFLTDIKPENIFIGEEEKKSIFL